MEGFEDTQQLERKKYISLKKPEQKKLFSNMKQFSIRMMWQFFFFYPFLKKLK
jgi:hypothetical protein